MTAMTGEDFEVLLAVGACATPPRDGRPPLDYITLERVLGARYSGDPYDRGVEWESAVPEPALVRGAMPLTNHERTAGALDKLEKLALIRSVDPPPHLDRRGDEVYVLTLAGWLMLSFGGQDGVPKP